MPAFISRHAVLAYFALTFAISWGGVIAIVGPSGFPGIQADIDRLLPIAVLAMVAGPSLASIGLTALLYGTAGLRHLRDRLLTWRVGPRWYAIALLTAPLLMLALLLPLSLTSPDYLPRLWTAEDRSSVLLTGVAIAIAAGFIEELGWTGFATPVMLRRHTVLATGLVVGVMWAAWHLLVGVWASGTTTRPLGLASYMLDPFLFLVPFRVLMVWLYDRTHSLLLGMLPHVSLTATTRILGSPALAAGGASLVMFDILWAAAVATILLAIAVANGWHRSRRSLERRPI
jgi:hypothetical protein